ncbi:beta-defensin 119 [Marmota monax]|uniref:beta-defensin 119 n=1 Tax=Marmota monax TaxID=9995 RepID=UPI0026F1DD9C|nr:beta-defensin 119 [Marmota monax]
MNSEFTSESLSTFGGSTNRWCRVPGTHWDPCRAEDHCIRQRGDEDGWDIASRERPTWGRHSLLRCMGSMGVCRTACRKIEHTYFYCRNYQSCCLQSFMRINVAGKDEPGVLSYAKHWPKIP